MKKNILTLGLFGLALAAGSIALAEEILVTAICVKQEVANVNTNDMRNYESCMAALDAAQTRGLAYAPEALGKARAAMEDRGHRSRR